MEHAATIVVVDEEKDQPASAPPEDQSRAVHVFDFIAASFPGHPDGHPTEINLQNPPLKDTITVAAKDAMVVQFDAGNPGK